MQTFIRLDFDKGFRGSEHMSSLGGDGEHFEKGISCYKISKDNIFNAIENLLEYWTKEAGEGEFSDYDINIFEGYFQGIGSSWEDLATCEKNLHCIDGELFNEVMSLYERHETYLDYKDDLEGEDYITTEDYKREVENLFKPYF